MFKKLLDAFTKQNPDGSYTTSYLYQRLFRYFKPYLFRTILALIITIPIGSLDGAIAYSLKPYVDAMQVKTSIETVSYVPFVIVGFTFLQGLLNYLSIYLNGWLGCRIMCDLRRELFTKLQSLDVSYFDRTATGAVIQGYFQDPQSINTNILNNTKQMLTRLFSSLFLMGVLIYTSWKLSIIAIGILLLVLYPSTQIRKIIKNLAHEANNTTSNVLSYYTETVGGIRVIYGYNLPRLRLKKFDEFQRSLFNMAIKSTQAQGWLTPSMHIIASIGIAIIIWQGSLMVVSGALTTGGFVSFLAAMLMLYNPIKNLGGSILTAQMSLLSAGRIFALIDQEPMIVNKPNAKTLTDIRDRIEFRDVTFSYKALKKKKKTDMPVKEVFLENRSNAPVLNHISLTFHKGETVALVGASGGGKSTIASLIPRFYDVASGTITIDGVDIRDFTLESLRTNIALVTQDNFLFDGTIRENLLLAAPDANDAQLWEVLEKAYLTDFINTLPEKLETLIGERGVLLSGGQRQRLAIARAMLKNAPMVILDEATSALDNQSEAIVQKAMESLMADKTVIIIAHRLSTIRNADRIIVLENGEIQEEGSHDTLLSSNKRYASLYRTQFNEVPHLPDPSTEMPLTKNPLSDSSSFPSSIS